MSTVNGVSEMRTESLMNFYATFFSFSFWVGWGGGGQKIEVGIGYLLQCKSIWMRMNNPFAIDDEGDND